jgi:hypothetical protein
MDLKLEGGGLAACQPGDGQMPGKSCELLPGPGKYSPPASLVTVKCQVKACEMLLGPGKYSPPASLVTVKCQVKGCEQWQVPTNILYLSAWPGVGQRPGKVANCCQNPARILRREDRPLKNFLIKGQISLPEPFYKSIFLNSL